MKHRTILFLITVIVLSISLESTEATARYFEIERFHSDIEINLDGSIMVKETIDVDFTSSRHGIFREIPYKYRNSLGDVETSRIDVISVTDGNGRKRETKVSKQGNVVNIRIGSADRYVNGYQTYVIKYKVHDILLYLEDHDELYWNVTGTYWDVPIRESSCRVTIDSDKDIAKPQTGCYTGRRGSRESNCELNLTARGAEFTATRGLNAGEGLTIAYGWEKGLIEYPTDFDLFLKKINLRENWFFIFPFISLFAMIYLYRTRGRDPKVQESVVVQYEPPKFNDKYLNAAEVGALIDEAMDPRDLSGTMIGLAEKGYITIKEHKIEGLISLLDSVDYELIKEKEPDNELGKFEREFMDSIFANSPKSIMVSDMKKKFYKYLPGLSKTLFTSLTDNKFFNARPSVVTGKYIGYAFIIVIGGMLLATLYLTDYSLKAIFATAFSAIWPAVFAKAMPAKTRTGARILMQIKGFREFMMRADKDRLERLGKDVFYKYMPYAIALDVVDHWAEAFKGIADEPPRWYVSTMAFHAFSPVAFSKTVNATTSTLASTMFSAPRGSGVSGGGGGGGFSGGGGGGGGGGSW